MRLQILIWIVALMSPNIHCAAQSASLSPVSVAQSQYSDTVTFTTQLTLGGAAADRSVWDEVTYISLDGWPFLVTYTAMQSIWPEGEKHWSRDIAMPFFHGIYVHTIKARVCLLGLYPVTLSMDSQVLVR